jgi:hypothetical protein
LLYPWCLQYSTVPQSIMPAVSKFKIWNFWTKNFDKDENCLCPVSQWPADIKFCGSIDTEDSVHAISRNHCQILPFLDISEIRGHILFAVGPRRTKILFSNVELLWISLFEIRGVKIFFFIFYLCRILKNSFLVFLSKI